MSVVIANHFRTTQALKRKQPREAYTDDEIALIPLIEARCSDSHYNGYVHRSKDVSLQGDVDNVDDGITCLKIDDAKTKQVIVLFHPEILLSHRQPMIEQQLAR